MSPWSPEGNLQVLQRKRLCLHCAQWKKAWVACIEDVLVKVHVVAIIILVAYVLQGTCQCWHRDCFAKQPMPLRNRFDLYSPAAGRSLTRPRWSTIGAASVRSDGRLCF